MAYTPLGAMGISKVSKIELTSLDSGRYFIQPGSTMGGFTVLGILLCMWCKEQHIVKNNGKAERAVRDMWLW